MSVGGWCHLKFPCYSFISFLKSQHGSFIIMLCLTFTFFIVELSIGYRTNSMALIADSFHMLSDLLSLTIGFTSLILSQKKDKNPLMTYGWSRIEVIGALANCVFLLSLCFSIAVEAIQRIVYKMQITEPEMILIVGTMGLFINIFGIIKFQCHTGCFICVKKRKNIGKLEHSIESEKLLPLNDTLNDSEYSLKKDRDEMIHHHHGHNHGQMNLKGVLLHLTGDMIGSLVVIISTSIFIGFEGKPWTMYIDPLMSLILVSIILLTTIPLLRSSARVLILDTPKNINIDQLCIQLRRTFPCIEEIPLLHIWQLDSAVINCTLHVVMTSISHYIAHVDGINKLLRLNGIQHITIQPKFADNTLLQNIACKAQSITTENYIM